MNIDKLQKQFREGFKVSFGMSNGHIITGTFIRFERVKFDISVFHIILKDTNLFGKENETWIAIDDVSYFTILKEQNVKPVSDKNNMMAKRIEEAKKTYRQTDFSVRHPESNKSFRPKLVREDDDNK